MYRRTKTAAMAFTMGVFVMLFTQHAIGEWRIDIESKQVVPGQQGVTVDFVVYWDANLNILAIPVVVRELDPGSFWTGTLPYDIDGKASSHPNSHGVSWNWSIPWAVFYEGLQPSVPLSPPCSPDGDVGYDGISPDHFTVSAQGQNPGHGQEGTFAPPEPNGSPVLTITFDVTNSFGQFEFDTACHSNSLPRVFMIDAALPPLDYNHAEFGFTFNKGVITIAPCDVGPAWGDVNGDIAINPVDVIYMVNFVYKGLDARIPPPNSPYDCGDVDCDGAVNPVDMVYYTNYVYRGITPFPCNPCE